MTLLLVLSGQKNIAQKYHTRLKVECLSVKQ